MFVVMQQGATEEQVEAVISLMVEVGFDVHRSTGVIQTVLGGVGGKEEFDLAVFEVMEGVKEAHRIVSAYKLASRSFRPGGTVVKIRDLEIGGPRVVVMAGPSSVESRDQINRSADVVAAAGARVIRGGAFKPRSSPYAFQGLGEEGLRLLREAADRNGLLVVSEVMTRRRSRWSGSMPISCKWARATCRTSICCANSAASASRCCSSAAFPLLSKSCCFRRNISRSEERRVG